MLKLAIQAQLPIVAVTTRDVLNLPDVIKEVTGKTPVKYLPETKIAANTLYYLVVAGSMKVDALGTLYGTMTKAESTLLIVNAKEVVEPMFDAGEVPVPRSLLMKMMMAVVNNEKRADELLRGLGGCTIKEAVELCRLTMARDKSLTSAGLMATRKASFQTAKGLTQVDTAQDFYDPPKPLATWLAREKPFFLNSPDPRLRPRGLLMDGPPGTGKTAASKWIAAQLGVPLYRIDVGATKNKFVGNSEANMLTNLGRVDQEEPCVVLLDEVEKIFTQGGGDNTGVVQTMLSQMLWWLQEHKSRVLTIMTTNNVKIIPPELYREGRVDEVLYFGGLTHDEAKPFVEHALSVYAVPNASKGGALIDMSIKICHQIFKEHDQGARVSQAALTKAVQVFVKQAIKKGLAA